MSIIMKIIIIIIPTPQILVRFQCLLGRSVTNIMMMFNNNNNNNVTYDD